MMINFCPKCGNKLNGKHFCDDCKTNLINYMKETLAAEDPAGQDNSEYLSALDALTSQTKDAIRRNQEKSAAKRKEEELRRAGFDIQNGVLVKYTGPGGDVVVPEGVHEIGDSAFYESEITSVVIPEGVFCIMDWAFYGCALLKEVVLPESIRWIGEASFGFNEELVEINFPNRMLGIWTNAFSCCEKLNIKKMPSLEAMGSSAFVQTGIESVDFDVRWSLRYRTFERCEKLREVKVRGTTAIPESTFRDCTGLETVDLDGYILYIEEGAFSGCKNIKKVIVETSENRNLEYYINRFKDAFADSPNVRFVEKVK